MLYRELGRTGKKASVIGLGCENAETAGDGQVKELINAALDGGVNILDIFMPGREVRERIMRALGSRRKEVMIQGHLGSTAVNRQYDISRDLPSVRRYFEDMLRIFGGYIDIGMLFYLDSDKDFQGVFETGFIDYARQLQEKGDIGHIGFSSHNPETAMRVVNTGAVETMLFSINLAFDMHPAEADVLTSLEEGFKPGTLLGIDPKRAELYRLCEQKGVGITVMKTFGAGKLLSWEHTPFQTPMTPAQCIHYALCRPAVASVLLGCKNSAEVQNALTYLDISDEERDYAPVLQGACKSMHGSCVYCNHCLPCPSEIDIAAVNKYLDIARLDEERIPPSVRSHYQSLAHRAEECTACGSCEGRCPFGVPVIRNMEDARRLLG